jgi:ribosomal protein L30E
MVEKLLKAQKEKRAVFGLKEVTHSLVLKNVDELFLTPSLAPEATTKLRRLASLAGAKVTQVESRVEEFSSHLKKPFNISVAAIRKVK